MRICLVYQGEFPDFERIEQTAKSHDGYRVRGVQRETLRHWTSFRSALGRTQ